MLGINQPPVTIKEIEVSIIDNAFDKGFVLPQVPDRLTGKTIAIIGSGPAGLAAAQQLTRAGHTVAVYERDDRIGGLLRYGIPDFKMEKKHIDRRIHQMEAEGTRFRTGVNVGVDISFDELRRRYDAILIATGALRARDISVPGRELSGVQFAMDYLTQANRVVAGEQVENQITAEGKNVVILGGGDTGPIVLELPPGKERRVLQHLPLARCPRRCEQRTCPGQPFQTCLRFSPLTKSLASESTSTQQWNLSARAAG